MDPYREFVRHYEEALGATLPAPTAPPSSAFPPPAPDAPVALLFSPHPDDEVITGALPLRLQREAGARVVNIAVTLGSNPGRREPRRRELADACACLGWEFEVLDWPGVNADAPDPAVWARRVQAIVDILRRWRPRWVFYPHAHDHHPAHIGVHLLVTAALAELGNTAAPPWRIQSEYWHPLAQPNLLVECPPAHLAELTAALACHRGEIARNPYHLTLPAWMIDNVRRGAELVGSRTTPAPTFRFGTLYRVEPNLPVHWPAILAATPALTA